MSPDAKAGFDVGMHVLGVCATIAIFIFVCINMFSPPAYQLPFNGFSLGMSFVSLTWIIGFTFLRYKK